MESHHRRSDLKSPDSTSFSIEKLEKYVNLKSYPPTSVSFRYYDKKDSKSILLNKSNYDVIIEAILYYDYDIAELLDSSCHCLIGEHCYDDNADSDLGRYLSWIILGIICLKAHLNLIG